MDLVGERLNVAAAGSIRLMPARPKTGLRVTRRQVRRIAYQSILVACLLAAFLFFAINIAANMRARSIGLSFGFLGEAASFDIGESVISFQTGDTIGRAFLAAMANTALVGVLAIILATVLGTLLALMRISSHILFARLAKVYVETVRNAPLLMQLFLWHTLLTRAFPPPRAAWRPIAGIFLTNRGVFVPSVSGSWFSVGLVCLSLAALLARRLAPRRAAATQWNLLLPFVCACIAVALWMGWENIRVEWPEVTRFNIRGGIDISSEFIAVLLGLTLYSSAFIAEIIRGGILSVPIGQHEAAQVLGLKSRPILWLIIFPQARAVITPALTSQYVTVIKNSSLAVAIGYPDIMRVQTIAISQTGHAIECCCIIIAIYLSISLIVSLAMTLRGRHHQKAAAR